MYTRCGVFICTVAQCGTASYHAYYDVVVSTTQPLELSYFCTKLKAGGIIVSKDRLADILDSLVSYSHGVLILAV